MGVKQDIKDYLDKATLGNIVSTIVVLAGLTYAMITGNNEIAAFIIGAAVPYLLPKKES